MPERSRSETEAIKNVARSLATVEAEWLQAERNGGDPKATAQYDALRAAAGLVARHITR
ncbi:hypothetical protein ACFUJR_14880 [Streptomyces sp. NPDC057271]|uniref:hypothetical protein n=1 Tax=unclassified Streptomyces TaxID=2593676 RepID=UPI00363D88B1